MGQGITSVNDFISFLQMKITSVRSLNHAKLCNIFHSFGPQESFEPGLGEDGVSAIYYAGEKFETACPHRTDS